MEAKRIYLIEHGETEENLQGIHQGQAIGGTLSTRGRADVLTVAGCLAAAPAGIDLLLFSPLSRCRESAALLADRLRPNQMSVDGRLSAKDSGYLGGWPRELAAFEAARHGVPIHQLRTPGGESSEDVQARYRRLWRDVCARPHRTTVLLGHGGGIACLLLWLTGRGFEHYLEHVPGSAGVTQIDIIDATPTLRFVNAPPAELAAHLGPLTVR